MCDAGANGFMHKRPFGVCLLQSATLALVQSSMHLDSRVMSPRHSLPRRYGAHPSRGCRRGLNPPVSSRLLAM